MFIGCNQEIDQCPSPRLLSEALGVLARFLALLVVIAGTAPGAAAMLDLAVMALQDDSLPNSAGKVMLFEGPLAASLTSADAAAVVYGERSAEHVGYRMDEAGDVDGDGFGDLPVGRYSGTSTGEGGAVLLYGPIEGSFPATDAGLVLTNEEDADDAGLAVAGAGDLDDDGFDDLLVGAPRLSPVSWWEGGMYVVLGAASEPSKRENAARPPPVSFGHLLRPASARGVSPSPGGGGPAQAPRELQDGVAVVSGDGASAGGGVRDRGGR